MRIRRYRGRFYATWTEAGRTRRIALRTGDRAVAEQRFADLTAAPAGDTAADIYDAWLADLAARGRDTSRAETAWKALRPMFGALRPDQVSPELCRAYMRVRRGQGRADGTIGKELGCLRAALRRHAPHGPARLELPPRSAPRDRRLDRGEYARLRLAAKRVGLHVYVFVVLGLATAARRGALLELTWDRVDFKRGLIHLGNSAGAGAAGGHAAKGRATVPMTRHARRVLRLAWRMRTTHRVIEYGGKPVAGIRRGFASAARRAGLAGVTPHTLRHTAASWMAEAGVPMAEIAQYLGHTDDRITQRVYARFSPGHLRAAAAALE